MIGLHLILAGNVITFLELLLKLSLPFQILGLWLHLKEIFFDLTVTESIIVTSKKVQKQDLKNIKNVTRCRDGMPKSMQTR